MNWYYAAGGQQQGPVDEAQLDTLIAAGTVKPDTLIWREGMAGWQALRDARPIAGSLGGVPPAAAPPVAGGAGTAALGENDVRCSECGGVFSRDNAIQYGAVWVCAACKPRFLQKLREGAPAGGGSLGPSATGTYVDPATLVAQATSRGVNLDIGRCIGRAWDLMKSNFWLLVGATVVNTICQWVGGFMVQLVTSGIGGVVGNVAGPIAAGVIASSAYIIGPLVQAPLMAGLCFMFLKLARREEAGFADAFSGFSSFMPLALAGIVSTLLIYIWFLPAGACILVGASNRQEILTFVGLGLAILALPLVIYFAVSWMFTYLLVMDRKYDFWTAMGVSRQVVKRCWWSMFGLCIVVGLIQILGFLALCVGIFVTMTLLYGAIVYAYEDLFQGGSAT